MLFLEGETVTLRPLTAEDAGFVARWENDPAVREAMRGTGPISPAAVVDREREHELVVCVDDPVGYVSLHSINRVDGHGAVSYWIAPGERGHGYATDAVRTVVSYAFDHLRLHRIRADVREFNEASCRVLERLGFTREGCLRESRYVDGDHHDRYRYGLLCSEWE